MSSVEEVRAALVLVADQLRTVRHQVATAADRLEQADAGYADAGADHSSSLVPPQLPKAREQLDALGARLGTLDSMIEEYSFRL